MTIEKQQCLLRYLGYYTGPVDGQAGPLTLAATKEFQTTSGLPPDGDFGPLTDAAALDAVANGRFKQEVPSLAPKPKPATGTFWDSIKWFTEDEFKCKCGGRYCDGYPARMQEAVVRIADAAREHFGKPGHVISGLRCKQWNAHEGGVWNSQHQYGEAIDLRIDGVDSETLRQFVSQQPGHRYSYRINSTNVHFDIPAGPR